MLNRRNLIFYVLILAFFIRVYGMLFLDLGGWDEQFHALVAKNLMNNPFHPSLITDNLVMLDIDDWSLCHIWLSKPPLAFWPMAMSMKVFGVNEFALRLPSLIFSLLTIYLAYVIGKRLFGEKIGIITAFLYSVNGMLYQLNTGILSGDHVDTLLHLLCHLTMYVLLFKIEKPGIFIGSLIGFIIGLAFLTKWIMAFFIFFICFMYYIYVKRDFIVISKFGLFAVISFLMTVTPWLWWINTEFPEETRLILKGIITPISNVIQGHDGAWYYYLNSIRININELVYLPLLLFIYQTIKHSTRERVFVFLWIMVPLLLLSISSTKREVYIFISATPFFIIISLFIDYLNQYKLNYRKTVFFIQLLFFIVAIRYCVERVKPWKPRLEKPGFRKEMEALIGKTALPTDSIVLINEPNYIKARYYYGLLGYRYLNDSIIHTIKLRGFEVYNHVNGKYIRVD